MQNGDTPPDAVVVSALCTPIGTAIKGTLRDIDAYQLAESAQFR
jgi:acetyl-CoA C-acetyltransferase